MDDDDVQAAEYLKRAAEILDLATDIPDQATREFLNKCAADYMKMAQRIALTGRQNSN